MSYSTPELKDKAESIIKTVSEKLNALGVPAEYINDGSCWWPANEGVYCLLLENQIHFYIQELKLGWQADARSARSTGKLKIFINTFYSGMKTFKKRELIEADTANIIDKLVKCVKERHESIIANDKINEARIQRNLAKESEKLIHEKIFNDLKEKYPEYASCLHIDYNKGKDNLTISITDLVAEEVESIFAAWREQKFSISG